MPAGTAEENSLALNDIEISVIDLFVRGVQVLGLQKSVGQIYGLLFISPEPLSLDDIVDRLGISKGSASQGLKILKGLGAVTTKYLPGERRDHYVAQAELKVLVSGFVSGELMPHLESGQDRLAVLLEECKSDESEGAKFRKERVERLRRWHGRSSKLLKTIDRFLG
ncbi:MAG: hypothetical protein AAGJ79_12930 [Verrucomicrobiota bacterium]